jgi:hypothetical protein
LPRRILASLEHRNVVLCIVSLGFVKPDIFRLSTYESKFRNELGLKKKLKWFDWIAIHDHISHLGYPKVEVLLDGNLIPPKKVKKEINRNLKKREGRSITRGISACDNSVDEN